MTTSVVEAPVIEQETGADGVRHYVARYSDGTTWRGPSVTTVLSLAPQPWKAPWVAKSVSVAYEEHIKSGAELTEEVVKHCRASWKREAQAGKDQGSSFHELAEAYLRNEDWLTLERAASDGVRCAFSNWRGWFRRSGLEPVHIETRIFSRAGGPSGCYGGTRDLLCRDLQGRFVEVDHKTSNFMSEDYPLQTVAYGRADEEMGHVPPGTFTGYRPAGRLILARFSKEGSEEVWDSLEHPDLHWSRWDLFFGRFNAMRQLWHWLKEAE